MRNSSEIASLPLSTTTQQDPSTWLHLLISWLMFTCIYWVAACYKPFHVDEFYSWVYAERCTFKELVFLREFGIGHPPLYHILQKLVQNVHQLPAFLSVRITNYVLGSIFTIVFMNMFLKRKVLLVFCYAACLSATVFNVFIFSRMWGLVLLSSLLLVQTGQRLLIGDRSAKTYLRFAGLCVLGFLSDYSFILLSPYILIVALFNKRYLKSLLVILLGGVATCWVLVTYLTSDKTFESFFFSLFIETSAYAVVLCQSIFYFNYWEIGLLAFLAILGFLLVRSGYSVSHDSKTEMTEVVNCSIAILATVVSMYYLTNVTELVRVRHLFVVFALSAAVMMLIIWKNNAAILTGEMGVLTTSIIGGSLILLCADRFMWRGLLEVRFITILFPLAVLLLALTYSKLVLYCLSVFFLFSTLLYLPSGFVAGYFPPLSVEKFSNIIFEDEWAYSTEYFHHGEGKSFPRFVGKPKFHKFCRICEMGETDSKDNWKDRIGVIWSTPSLKERGVEAVTPSDWRIVSRRKLIREIDEVLSRKLSLIEGRSFELVEYVSGCGEWQGGKSEFNGN